MSQKKTQFTDEDVMAVANVIHLAWCREETKVPAEKVRDATRVLWGHAFVAAQELLETVCTPSLADFEEN